MLLISWFHKRKRRSFWPNWSDHFHTTANFGKSDFITTNMCRKTGTSSIACTSRMSKSWLRRKRWKHLEKKVNKSGLKDPGSPREMANDENGSTARDDLDRVPLTWGHVCTRIWTPSCITYISPLWQVHLPRLHWGRVRLCDNGGDWAERGGQADEGRQDMQVQLWKVLELGEVISYFTVAGPKNRLQVFLSSSHCRGECGSKPAVWIDGGIHAREWISPAATTWMLKELVENDAAHPDLLDNADWFILPSANPDGYDWSRNHNRMWRKTRSDNGGIFHCKVG